MLLRHPTARDNGHFQKGFLFTSSLPYITKDLKGSIIKKIPQSIFMRNLKIITTFSQLTIVLRPTLQFSTSYRIFFIHHLCISQTFLYYITSIIYLHIDSKYSRRSVQTILISPKIFLFIYKFSHIFIVTSFDCSHV